MGGYSLVYDDDFDGAYERLYGPRNKGIKPSKDQQDRYDAAIESVRSAGETAMLIAAHKFGLYPRDAILSTAVLLLELLELCRTDQQPVTENTKAAHKLIDEFGAQQEAMILRGENPRDKEKADG